MDNSKSDIIQKIKEILMKKAEGFSYQEVIEEYQTDEKSEKKVAKQMVFPSFEEADNKKKHVKEKKEKLQLTKKKITTLFQPPDLAAIKMLLDMFITDSKSDLEKMSNEELMSLKDELIEKLKEIK